MKTTLILIASLLLGVLIGLFAFPRPAIAPSPATIVNPAVQTKIETEKPATVQVFTSGEFTLATPSAPKYVPPAERNPDMQMFDRAVLFLSDAQEEDGHWSSARTFAAKEFQNLNGDIALTGISAYVLMCSSTATFQNPAAVARAGKAMRWLESKINADGTVGETNGPGEQTIAQLMAGSAYLQAASMSTREGLRQTASRLISVALMKMKAKNGGYGPDMNSDEPRADVLGLSAFVYKSASLEGYQFELPKPGGAPTPPIDPKDTNATKERAKAQRAAEDAIIETLRAGFKRLELADAKAGTGKGSGVFAQKFGGPAEWNATVACMLANFLINPQRSSVNPALDFVFGELDKKSESYPKIPATLRWGEKGEGYNTLTSWYGTMAVVYLFTDDKPQHKAWTTTLQNILKAHQLPDGGWAVAGEDLQRGRIWRTALHAMTVILIAPPPPPPGPPADTVNTPALPETSGATKSPSK